MNEKRVLCLSAFLLILCVGLACASFQAGTPSHSIDSEYNASEEIRGWLNISLDNEPNNSLFNDSLGNSMTLLELIQENSGFVYNATGGNLTNSSFQLLYLDNGSFFSPGTPGNYTYKLNLNGVEIFSQNISVIAGVVDVNTTLHEKIDALASAKQDISGFDSFTQQVLNEILKINETETELENLRVAYENASAEESEISANLSKISVPESVRTSRSSTELTFLQHGEDINLEVLEDAGMGTYNASEEDEYTDAILLWNHDNLDVKIIFNELSGIYNGTEEVIAKIFEVNISQKENLNYSPVFAVEKLDSLTFKEDYGQKESGDYFYIEIPDEEETIVFSTSEDIEFSDLPMFTSPPVSKLSLRETYTPPEEEEKPAISKWLIFSIVIFFIIIIGVIVYLSLHSWYKKKYEGSLFKNKNDLYNIATYITTSKAKGLNESQINENLRRANWSAEQVRYAMRKYAGKNTGMPGKSPNQ